MPTAGKNFEDKKTEKIRPDRKTLRRLYTYAVPYLPRFFLILLLILISIGVTLFQPRLIQLLIDDHLSVFLSSGGEGNLSGALTLVMAYLAAVVIQFAAGYTQAYLLHQTGQKILRSLRRDLYQHILSLPMAFFDRYPQGSLVTRVTNDTEALNEMFTSVLSSVFKSLFTLAGIIVMMYAMDARLATYVLALMPFIIGISVIFRRVIRKVYDAQRRLLSRINTKLSENISGMRTIQIFHRQDQVHSEFDEINTDYLRLGAREVRSYAIYRPLIEIIRSLGIAGLIWMGGKSHLSGLISFGILYAFIEYIQRFFQPILELAETYNIIQSALTSTNRIFQLLDQVPEDKGGKVQVPEEGLAGRIEFQNVWFAYNEGEWVLKDVSFTVEPGEFAAFVGATGAGKSTIMHLLTRFYDINRGRILIDGVDIRDYDLKTLRKAVGVVQQDVFVYSGTILDNITLKRPDLSYEEAREAARIVRADSFIDRLPRRYDEPVTEGGSTLSAGQRQLLSFARTIASHPSLLILDEATAKIDTETELLIQEAIARMARDRSMIAVAHRISTIADADKIIVMHEGRIAEEGSREELLARDGLFRLLYQLQYEEA